MTREFLEELALPQEVAEAVWQAHEQALQQVRFDHSLEKAIEKARGRNAKAITALLDLEALRAAPDTLEEALNGVKKENGYLFHADRPPLYPPSTGTNPQLHQAPDTLAGALRERFEKKK